MRESFASPDTEFRILHSAEGDHDGCRPGEPTGVVECARCGRRSENVDHIPHAPGCPQRHVHSEWFRATR